LHMPKKKFQDIIELFMRGSAQDWLGLSFTTNFLCD